MPKQNFLSTDFFVAASEASAKEAALSLPGRHGHITLLREHNLTHSLRYLFEHNHKPLQNYVDLSILPLDNLYVRISLHASYTDGKSFHSDFDIAASLQAFEEALQGALHGTVPNVRVTPSPVLKPYRPSLFAKAFAGLLFSRG